MDLLSSFKCFLGSEEHSRAVKDAPFSSLLTKTTSVLSQDKQYVSFDTLD